MPEDIGIGSARFPGFHSGGLFHYHLVQHPCLEECSPRCRRTANRHVAHSSPSYVSGAFMTRHHTQLDCFVFFQFSRRRAPRQRISQRGLSFRSPKVLPGCLESLPAFGVVLDESYAAPWYSFSTPAVFETTHAAGVDARGAANLPMRGAHPCQLSPPAPTPQSSL